MSKLDANDIAREQGPDGLAAVLDRKTATAEPATRNTTNTQNAEGAGNGPPDWPVPIPFQRFDDLPPFPVDTLPGWAGEIVKAVAVATQTPPDLAGGLLLAVLGTCGAGKLRVAVNDGWTEPLNLFSVITLPPGNRKSAVFTIMAAPLTGWERAEAERLGPEIVKAKADYDVTEQRLKELKARAAKCQDAGERAGLVQEAQEAAEELADKVIPVVPRLFVDDVTPEKLGNLLCEHGGRLAVLSPEGDIFEIMAGRYSDGANFGVFLRGHAGDTLRVDRLGRGTDHVEAPALTLGLCVQPDVIESLSGRPGFRGRGLLGRFLYSLPLSPLGHREIEPPPVPLPMLASYQRNVLGLLSLPWATDGSGRRGVFTIALSPEARHVLRAFQTELEPKLKAGGDLDGLTDWAAKLAGAVARMAGGLHLVVVPSEPWQTPIAADTMNAAVRLGHYYTEHAKAAFCLMGTDPVIEMAKRVLGWMERKGCPHFTRRELCQDLRVRAANLTDPLNLLIEHDYIRPEPALARVGPGRRPSTGPHVFDVNPMVRTKG